MSLLLAMKSLARSLILMIYFSRQLVQLEKRLDGCFDSSKISELIIKPTDIIIELIEPTERMGRRFIDCLKGSQFLSLDQNSIQVFRETFRNWMLEWKTIFRRWKDILHEISASETFPQTFQDLAYESEESLVCCDKKVQHLCYCIESIAPRTCKTGMAGSLEGYAISNWEGLPGNFDFGNGWINVNICIYTHTCKSIPCTFVYWDSPPEPHTWETTKGFCFWYGIFLNLHSLESWVGEKHPQQKRDAHILLRVLDGAKR